MLVVCTVWICVCALWSLPSKFLSLYIYICQLLVTWSVKIWKYSITKVLNSRNNKESTYCIYFWLRELYMPYMNLTHTYMHTHTQKCSLLETFSDFLFLLGQHCLDPDAYILDVYHVNPQAEWVIKPQSSFWNIPQDGSGFILYAKKILH